MSDEITRGREPITVKITPSLAIFVVTGISAVVGAVLWLKMIDTTAVDNTRRVAGVEDSLRSQGRRLQLLEWQLSRPTPARLQSSSSPPTSQTAPPLQPLTQTR